MMRLKKAPTVTLSILLISVFFVCLAAFAGESKDATIKDLKLGECIFGENYSADDLQDRVVAVEFWGER